MVFNSLQFLVFFIIVTSLYFVIAPRYRWALLLFASCYFYMAYIANYIIIMVFTIVIDYCAGIWIQNAHGRQRKLYLVISLAANIGVLAFFKYYDFFNNGLNSLLHYTGHQTPFPLFGYLLPIGLSFHTFQAMSYTIEVYRGNQKAETHFGIYALYVMFYPQLVAGPIERPQNLLHQFREKHELTFDNLQAGLLQMAFGLFKKAVIADRLAIAVDYSFANYQHQSGLSLCIAAVFYSFQIYCDFSGYSDMAIGAARVMGFKLMTNFNAPYLSRSIPEFWKRWHISLSTWFRDYLYIPLGGNRVKVSRFYINILIVFLISGLWHGANWTFVIWGLLHGIYFLINNWVLKAEHAFKINWFGNRAFTIPKILLTFALVTIAWILFRAENAGQACAIIRQIFHTSIFDSVNLSLNTNELIFSLLLIVGLIVKEQLYPVLKTNKMYVFLLLMGLILFSSYFFGVFNNRQFIYFRF